tara:strand:- start:1 stop:525 length:525 start_codon:yes stop_codon:yes gene_type:complete
MTNKTTGIVKACFDNRQYQGQISKYPSYKIMMGDEEFVAYTNNEISIKQGDNISLEYDISKKTGKKFVLSDFATKKPKIQVIPQNGTTPTEEIPIDDDLRNYEPDHFASNGVVEKPSDFNYGANVSKPVDKKSLEMFCMAMAKSALESNQLKADKQSIANFIKDMIAVYSESFR